MPPYHATHVALSAYDAQLYVAQMEYTGESMVMSLGGVQKQEQLSLNWWITSINILPYVITRTVSQVWVHKSRHDFVLVMYGMIRYLFTVVGFPPGGSRR